MNDWEPKSNGSPEGDAFVKVWHRIREAERLATETWIHERILMGYAAAHPDDGWVDRQDNTVTFVYPQFLLPHKMAPGALVALGSHHEWRPVRLLGQKYQLLGRCEMWMFETLPQHKPLRWWERLFGSDPHIWQRPRGAPKLACVTCGAERYPSWGY